MASIGGKREAAASQTRRRAIDALCFGQRSVPLARGERADVTEEQSPLTEWLRAAGSGDRDAGGRAYAEIYADRSYLPNGRLVPRSQPEAVIHDPKPALARLISFFETGLMPVIGGDPIPLAAQSICIHGDSPQAVAMAHVIRDGLAARGLTLRAFGQ